MSGMDWRGDRAGRVGLVATLLLVLAAWVAAGLLLVGAGAAARLAWWLVSLRVRAGAHPLKIAYQFAQGTWLHGPLEEAPAPGLWVVREHLWGTSTGHYARDHIAVVRWVAPAEV